MHIIGGTACQPYLGGVIIDYCVSSSCSCMCTLEHCGVALVIAHHEPLGRVQGPPPRPLMVATLGAYR